LYTKRPATGAHPTGACRLPDASAADRHSKARSPVRVP